MWDLWWLGNTDSKVRPHRFLKLSRFRNRPDINIFSKKKKVIELLQQFSKECVPPVFPEGISCVSEVTSQKMVYDNVFNKAYRMLLLWLEQYLTSVKRKCNREEELSVSTVYGIMQARKKWMLFILMILTKLSRKSEKKKIYL